MFNSSGNNSPLNSASPKNSSPTYEKMPVFNMKKDLENADNPNYISEYNSSTSISAAPLSTTGQIQGKITPQPSPFIEDKKRTSPFLSQENNNILPENNKPALEIKANPKEIKINPQEPFPADIDQEKSLNWGKVIVISVIVFVSLAAGFGGYFFWMNKQSTLQEATPPIAEIPTIPTAPTELSQSFSTEKPNYLSIDIENADSPKIKEVINTYSQDVSNKNVVSPVEFIITDKKNTPVNFDVFASKIGITLPADVTTNFENSFSLFIYNDNGKARLGLALDLKDATEENTQKALLKNESALVPGLKPIFSVSNYTVDEKKIFSTSSYGGAEIRYLNIISPEELSVDYTILQKKLLIGTTKQGIRSIIDYTTKNATPTVTPEGINTQIQQ